MLSHVDQTNPTLDVVSYSEYCRVWASQDPRLVAVRLEHVYRPDKSRFALFYLYSLFCCWLGLPFVFIFVLIRSSAFSEVRAAVLKRADFTDNICPVCKRVFKRKDHVQRHYLELHIFNQENMGYPCTSCDKFFKRKYILDNHMKTCAGSPKCQICHVTYSKFGQLIQHMKNVHNAIIK